MGDFTLAHRRYVNSGNRIGVIDDKAYAVNNVYVIQSFHNNNFATRDRMPSSFHNNNFATRDRMPPHNNKYQISKTSGYNNNNNNNNNVIDHHQNRSWYSKPEFNRKRRVAKYKIYSMEGKVKRSFKNSYRWFKQTCSRLIHGF